LLLLEISGSHGGEYEDDILGSCTVAMQSRWSLQTFQRRLRHSSSGLWLILSISETSVNFNEIHSAVTQLSSSITMATANRNTFMEQNHFWESDSSSADHNVSCLSRNLKVRVHSGIWTLTSRLKLNGNYMYQIL
jgi:hypothetical protein